jgi:chromosome segregation ATPase
LNKQLSQQKDIVSKQKVAIAKLSSDKEAGAASSKLSSDLSKERNQLREQLKKLTANEKSAKTELEGANSRIEKLKNHLRTYQKKMTELQKRLQQSESELKVARAAPRQEADSTAAAPKLRTLQKLRQLQLKAKRKPLRPSQRKRHRRFSLRRRHLLKYRQVGSVMAPVVR